MGIQRLMRLLRNLSRQERMEDDLGEELRFHLQKDVDKTGMTPEEARDTALRRFGGVDQVKEGCRDVRAIRFFEGTWQDICFGLRMLRRNPGFTTVVILTLALGIGMNTAVFSVLNSVLLRSLAYPDADRLVWLANYDDYFKQDTWGSRADYLLWRDQAHSFAGMAAYGNQDLALVVADQASQERIASVTGDFWSIVGARPTFGHLFRQGEPDTIVLSYRLFERRFGADSQVIGKSVTLNGHSFTVVGVLSEAFRFLLPQQWVSGDERREIDAYVPIPDAVETPGQPVTQKHGPAPFWVSVVGKLKPNIPIDQARAEMETIFARIAREYPTPLRNRSLHFIPLKEKLVGSARTALMVLLAAVGFVLLIASVNVANLLLARASVRKREIAIRAALGAGRMRVIRQLLVESVLLALLGGMAGLLLSRWCLALMVRLGSEAVPRLAETQTDGWVLSFTLGVSLLTGLLFGLGPAITLGRTDLHDALKMDARTPMAAVGRLRGRGLLVALQLALAIILLTGAGLMLKSFWRMNAKPPGFTPESILVMRVSLSGPQYRSWPPQEAYLHELLRRVNTAPGVLAVGIDCGTLNTAVRVEGAQQNSTKAPLAAVRFVSPGYLRAIGVPLIKGRWPTDGEFLDVVLVNQSFTRKMVSSDPVGRPISGSFLSGTMAGVVADFKYWQLDAEPRPEVYMAYEWSPVVRSVRVVVRVSGEARLAASTIRNLISGIDRAQPVYELQTLEQALSDSIAPRRFNLFLLGTFAATALLLGLIGIYGVIAYSVAQRTNEIGIRRALGAQRGEIVRMVVWQGMQMALAGIGVGLGAALGLTRLMGSLLYDVKANDPLTFAAVALTLSVTALLALLIPALRAALVDPTVALRCE